MDYQLNFNGEQVPVCAGCGAPPTMDNAPFRENRCLSCRGLSGEETAECDGCGVAVLEGDLCPEYLYLSPFDDDETETGLSYCQSCIDRGLDREQTFYCDACDRTIVESHGHMMYYRFIDGETLCLRCIATELKAGGTAAMGEEVLHKVTHHGHAFGMFFNVGELEAEGWVAHPDWDDVLYDASHRRELAATTLALHERDEQFIIGYERLSTLGDEGYITLYVRPEQTPAEIADAADAFLREVKA